MNLDGSAGSTLNLAFNPVPSTIGFINFNGESLCNPHIPSKDVIASQTHKVLRNTYSF